MQNILLTVILRTDIFYIMSEELEVIESLYKHARFLRSASKEPRRSKAAAEWEIFFEGKLSETKRAETVANGSHAEPEFTKV